MADLTNANLTTNSAKAWAPDERASASPRDEIPDALILTLSTKGGQIEGDAPSVRVPYIVDSLSAIVGEGAEIPLSNPTLDEITFNTHKISKLVAVSHEQAAQDDGVTEIANSIRRSVTDLANAQFVASSGAATPGLLGVTNAITTEAGMLGLDAWAAFDALASLEDEGGAATHWLMNPLDWAIMAKIPTETGSNSPALGDLHTAPQRQLAGIPVSVSKWVPKGKALVLNRAEIISAYGTLNMARSEDALFSNDAVALRATWRMGWGIPRPTRAGRVLTVARDWAKTTAVVLGERVVIGTAVLQASAAGTTGSTAPTAPAAVDDTVTDGTVTWTRVV